VSARVRPADLLCDRGCYDHAELTPWRSDLIKLQVRHREDLAEDANDGDAAAGSRHYLPAWDVAYGLEAAAVLLAADAHRESIAALLAPWFARRTAAGLAAAFAGTSVSAERMPGFGIGPASRPGRLAKAAVGG
jgi:hypothetical protein